MGVADFQSLTIRQLHDQAFADQSIQRLLTQLAILRQRLIVSGRIVLHLEDQAIELAGQHHILIDDGNDAIQGLGGGQGRQTAGAQQSRGQNLMHVFLHQSHSGSMTDDQSFRLNGRV